MSGVLSWVFIPVRVLLVLAVAALVSWAVFRRLTITQHAGAAGAGTVAQPHSSLTLSPPMDDGAGGDDPAASTAAGGADPAVELPANADRTEEPEQGTAPDTAQSPPAPADTRSTADLEQLFEVDPAVPMTVSGPGVPSPGPSPSPSAARRSDLAAIRVWAREHGYVVADRGRIAAAVVAAYDERR